jgi:hypothetical protein
MWRKTSPAEFWTSYRQNHPDAETFDTADTPATDTPANSGH